MHSCILNVCCAELSLEINVFPASPGTVDSLNTLEELRETDESDSVSLSQPRPSSSSSHPPFARLCDAADSSRAEEPADARCALAKVLTSSVSKGTLVKRLKNSATFPKILNGSSSVTQRRPENGSFCAELTSVLNSDLPTESDWEDPVQRKGMTTFKVVPTKNLMPHDPELSLKVPDQSQETTEDNPETEDETNQAEPDKSEAGSPLPDQVHSAQDRKGSDASGSAPPPHDLDSQGSSASPLLEFRETDEGQKEEHEGEVTCEVTPAAPSDHSEEELTQDGSEDQSAFLQSPRGPPGSTDEEVVQEEEVEEEDRFPPPPPPVFFSENLTEGGEEDGAASLPLSQPTGPACNGQAGASCETHHQHESTSERPRPAAPSRFAQAVAMAVQRSRLQSQGKGVGQQDAGGPQSALPSGPRSTYQYGKCC